MHYYALVVVPDDADVDAAVTAAMAPYDENIEDETGGFWDWWSIGGRWTGYLDDGYDPRTDRRNMEACWLCGGTGSRGDWIRFQTAPFCNGCDSTGIAVKFASQWVRTGSDITTVGAVPADKVPFTLVTPEGAFHKETWDGDTFQDSAAALHDAWRDLPTTTRVVVVDYHC